MGSAVLPIRKFGVREFHFVSKQQRATGLKPIRKCPYLQEQSPLFFTNLHSYKYFKPKIHVNFWLLGSFKSCVLLLLRLWADFLALFSLYELCLCRWSLCLDLFGFISIYNTYYIQIRRCSPVVVELYPFYKHIYMQKLWRSNSYQADRSPPLNSTLMICHIWKKKQKCYVTNCLQLNFCSICR